jgi:hypothetical protein
MYGRTKTGRNLLCSAHASNDTLPDTRTHPLSGTNAVRCCVGLCVLYGRDTLTMPTQTVHAHVIEIQGDWQDLVPFDHVRWRRDQFKKETLFSSIVYSTTKNQSIQKRTKGEVILVHIMVRTRAQHAQSIERSRFRQAL